MERREITSEQNVNPSEIQRLITDLSSNSREVRENARSILVSIGRPAIHPLLEQFKSPDKWLRWEAAKALAEMKEPSAAPILVASLTNDDPSIRWLAAEGLIALDSISLIPILEALTHFSGSIWLGRGAHHVLHDLYTGRVHEGESEYEPIAPLTEEMKAIIRPVLESLEPAGSVILTPEYARIALNNLKQLENDTGKDTSSSEQD